MDQQIGDATFSCGPQAPLLARMAVSGWLDGCTPPDLQADVGLLVSELVTNSVRHAGQPTGAPVHIRVATLDGGVRVEVEDDGHGPVLLRAGGPSHQGGFGLRLVETLAARWGVSHQHGTRVWFELAARSPAT